MSTDVFDESELDTDDTEFDWENFLPDPEDDDAEADGGADGELDIDDSEFDWEASLQPEDTLSPDESAVRTARIEAAFARMEQKVSGDPSPTALDHASSPEGHVDGDVEDGSDDDAEPELLLVPDATLPVSEEGSGEVVFDSEVAPEPGFVLLDEGGADDVPVGSTWDVGEPGSADSPEAVYDPGAVYDPPVYDPGAVYDPPVYDPGAVYDPPVYDPGAVYDPPVYDPGAVYDPPVYDPGAVYDPPNAGPVFNFDLDSEESSLGSEREPEPTRTSEPELVTDAGPETDPPAKTGVWPVPVAWTELEMVAETAPGLEAELQPEPQLERIGVAATIATNDLIDARDNPATEDEPSTRRRRTDGRHSRVYTATVVLACSLLVLVAVVLIIHSRQRPSTPAASPPAPTAAGSVPAPSVLRQAARIKAATDEVNLATTTALAGMSSLPNLPSPADVAQVVGPYAESLQLYGSFLSGADVPPSARATATQVLGQVRVDAAFLGTIEGLAPAQLSTYLHTFYTDAAQLQGSLIALENELPSPSSA